MFYLQMKKICCMKCFTKYDIYFTLFTFHIIFFKRHPLTFLKDEHVNSLLVYIYEILGLRVYLKYFLLIIFMSLCMVSSQFGCSNLCKKKCVLPWKLAMFPLSIKRRLFIKIASKVHNAV